jgi:hypothetical protein
MCTIDEIMIYSKGTYCFLLQYIPRKPKKWGIKVWCMGYSVTKFVLNFIIYCGKNDDNEAAIENLKKVFYCKDLGI